MQLPFTLLLTHFKGNIKIYQSDFKRFYIFLIIVFMWVQSAILILSKFKY